MCDELFHLFYCVLGSFASDLLFCMEVGVGFEGFVSGTCVGICDVMLVLYYVELTI